MVEVIKDVTRKDGMEYCIVRTPNLVFAGFVERKEGSELRIVEARQLRRWYAVSLSILSMQGSTDRDKCWYDDEIPVVYLRGWTEMYPCSEVGMKSILEDVE